MLQISLLSLIIWLPIVGGLVVLSIHSISRSVIVTKVVTLVLAIVNFLLSLLLYWDFDSGTAAMQFVERFMWIEMLNIEYFVGLDGISILFVILTTFLSLVVVIAGLEGIHRRVHQYFAAFLVMEGLMIGVFCALDAILFYLFWEAMLIPMYLIIGIWGGDNRVYAAMKFFLYTLVGSLLMLLGFVYLYFVSGNTFSILDFHNVPLSEGSQILLFIAFLSAFAVKVPMVPVHTWLPDAHVEAPTAGSVILAAVMLKMGAYGFLRISLPITPDASHQLAGLMITLSLVAVVYIAFVALVQTDMKKLIAYSSISHMGFVTLGFFIFNIHGIEGALIQMVSHGFISGALFLCVGALYDRLHSREIEGFGGVAKPMPRLALFFLLFAMANVGLPGTSGFVGEFLVVMGAFQKNAWLALAAGMTLVLGAGYTLWMIRRVIFGPVEHQQVAVLDDVGVREV
ncbi:MAG: NADH-quinone oxidoreductase subunit M, partial [Acidiferrobacteraceae bacterium]|nr:NADH-quinone oxidoreductase subunit M [Acidiferrobacteraceae bacterium]